MRYYIYFVLSIFIAMYPFQLIAQASDEKQNLKCCAQGAHPEDQVKLIKCYGKKLIDEDGNSLKIMLGFDISTSFKLSETFFIYRIQNAYTKLSVPQRQHNLTQWISIEYAPKLEYYLLLKSEMGQNFTIFSNEKPCIIKSAELKETQSNLRNTQKGFKSVGSAAAAILSTILIPFTGGLVVSSDSDSDSIPKVVNTIPSDNSKNVPQDIQVVLIEFNSKMDTSVGVILTNSDKWQVPLNAIAEWSSDFRALSISRQNDILLGNGKIINFTLNGFKGANGLPMSQYNFGFQIAENNNS